MWESAFVVLITFTVSCGTTQRTSEWVNDGSFDGQILVKYVMDTVNDVSRIQCAGICESRAHCLIFFYSKYSRSCQLNSDEMLKYIPGILKYVHQHPGTRCYHRANMTLVSPHVLP